MKQQCTYKYTYSNDNDKYLDTVNSSIQTEIIVDYYCSLGRHLHERFFLTGDFIILLSPADAIKNIN